MCLAVVAYRAHPDWPLMVIANRDEFHERPSVSMQPWADEPALLAGQDLRARGTWLGITDSGRFALLTNVRDPKNNKAGTPSRGQLPESFLKTNQPAGSFMHSLACVANRYNGFNLLVSDGQELWHGSNYQRPFANSVTSGVHGLSNALLDTDWPKTVRTREALASYLQHMACPCPESLQAIMLDRTGAPDDQLPQTGIRLERERLLASPFIVSPDYGTRCTTIVLQRADGLWWVQEDSFDPTGQLVNRIRWTRSNDTSWQATHREPGNL